MKRILWLAVIFFFLVPQAVAWGSSSTQSLSLSFPDGGFELNPTDPASSWVWPATDWTWEGAAFHSGGHSARVSRFTGDETASLWSISIPVQPSGVYTLSFWFRSENASKNPSVVIYQYTSGDIQTGLRQIVYSNVGSGTNDWSSVSYRFQTMPDASAVKLRLYLYTDTSGTFWFDDFYLDGGVPAVFPYLQGFPVEASGWVNMSSPTVADINHDNANELIIGAGNEVNGWDRFGNPLPGYPLATNDRYIYNQLAVADLNADNKLEIFAGTRTANPPEGQCHVYAWQDNGVPLSGWPISVEWNPDYSNNDCKVTSIVVADIDGNQRPDILASTTNNASGNPNGGITPQNLYAWNSDGTNLNGSWPSKHTAAGFYGAIAAGDLSGDGTSDVIVARDHHILNAYSGDGISLPGWPIDTYLYSNQGDYDTDYRVVYGRSAPVLADLDNDGNKEYIVIGNVSGPGNFTDAINTALLVFNKDGTRYQGWETPALGNGVLTQEDLPQKSPAIADINSDGFPEIIAATMDGWIRVYDLHKTLLWGFDYSQGATLFASEPVIGDIDGDNQLEVVFGTYVPISGNDYDGPVGIWSLESNGTVTPGFPLPVPTPGVEAAPTLADLDGDHALDILAASINGYVMVWDTSSAYFPSRFPWPMGRHDLQRTATYTDPNSFGKSRVIGTPYSVQYGDIAKFSIHISSVTPINDVITLTDTIPPGVTFIPGTLSATSGTATYSNGVIQWSGILPKNLTVDITYEVFVDATEPLFIVNTVLIDTSIEGIIKRDGYLFANTFTTFLPSLHR